MFKASMSKLIKLLIVVSAGFVNTPIAVAQQACYAPVTTDLELVGETRLRVYLWRVYDATLYTASGGYPDDTEVALQLNYLRNISAAQLVVTTRDEWQTLGYELDEQAEQWLAELSEMWPDVREGDCLIAHAQTQQGVDFYTAQGALGSISDAAFAERFLAIWLSEDSSFRRNRDELIGAR